MVFINMASFRMSCNMRQLLSSMPHPNREAKQPKEERFGSQFEDTVHLGRERQVRGTLRRLGHMRQ